MLGSFKKKSVDDKITVPQSDWVLGEQTSSVQYSYVHTQFVTVEDPQHVTHQVGISLSLQNLALVFIIFVAVVGVEFLLDMYRVIEYKA